MAKPANTLYRHNLTATLETAIRSSSAQNDSTDVLRRLDARMLEYSHGEIGWDVFTLEYKVDAPIDTVLDPEAMEQYLKLFRHLWQIKRIEMTLNRGWMRITGGAHTFLRIPGNVYLFSLAATSLILFPCNEDLQPTWHRVRIVMAEMIHFIRQVQAYCRLEVIECSWMILIDFLNKKEGDLDSLIEAHRSFLDRVVKKILIWSPKLGKEVLFSLAILTLSHVITGEYSKPTQRYICLDPTVPGSDCEYSRYCFHLEVFKLNRITSTITVFLKLYCGTKKEI